MLEAVIKALFDALLGAAVSAFNSWRRDEDLKRLGHAQSEIDALRRKDREWREFKDALDKGTDSDIDAVLKRL